MPGDVISHCIYLICRISVIHIVRVEIVTLEDHEINVLKVLFRNEVGGLDALSWRLMHGFLC